MYIGVAHAAQLPPAYVIPAPEPGPSIEHPVSSIQYPVSSIQHPVAHAVRLTTDLLGLPGTWPTAENLRPPRRVTGVTLIHGNLRPAKARLAPGTTMFRACRAKLVAIE